MRSYRTERTVFRRSTFYKNILKHRRRITKVGHVVRRVRPKLARGRPLFTWNTFGILLLLYIIHSSPTVDKL